MVEPEREPAYDEQLRVGPWQARLIKLADVYDNLSDALTEKQRRTFIRKAARALGIAGDDPRLARGRQVLEDAVAAMERELGA